MKIMRDSFPQSVGLSIVLLGFLQGCKSYESLTKEFRESWDAGDSITALGKLQEAGEHIEPGHNEELLYNLEMASVARANQEKNLANQHLDHAKAITEQHFGGGLLKAKGKGIRQYTGYFYDRNMLEVYRALDAMEEGNTQRTASALTELRFKRQEAQHLHLEEIQKAERKAYSQKDGNYQKFSNHPDVAQKVSQLYDHALAIKYRSFYNPMGDYLRLIMQTRGGLDLGVNVQNLQREGVGREARFLQGEGDVQSSAVPYTYVFLETGSSPKRVEEKFSFPVGLFTDKVGGVEWITFAMPKLIPRNDFEQSGTVAGVSAPQPYHFEELVDMDSVVTSEFKEHLPGELAKAFVQVVMSVIAQMAIDAGVKSIDDSPMANLIGSVAKAVVADSVANADTRSWYTLPKKVMVCRLPTPPDGQFLARMASGQTLSFQVNPRHPTNVVYLKTIKQGGLITLVSNFALGTQGRPPPPQPSVAEPRPDNLVVSAPALPASEQQVTVENLQVQAPVPLPAQVAAVQPQQPTGFREWINTLGAKVYAKFERVQTYGEVPYVVLLLPDNREVSAKVSELSEQDNRYIQGLAQGSPVPAPVNIPTYGSTPAPVPIPPTVPALAAIPSYSPSPAESPDPAPVALQSEGTLSELQLDLPSQSSGAPPQPANSLIRPAASTRRSWTNIHGQTIQGEFIRVQAYGNIPYAIFRLQDNREVSAKISELSKADIQYLRNTGNI